jgi:UDP-2-acetamido-3-amino-2,3-dideoxy-glucuronate N-acetyltransferase
MMSKPFEKKLALIGAGNWGKHLARNFYEIGALHTLCDADEQCLQNYREHYSGITTTSNSQDVFDDPTICQVVIAAPAVEHFPLAKKALESGKDVFVEKPLCLDLDDAKKLVEIADQHDRILMVGHLLHYHPAFIHLKQLVDGGEIGVVKHIACHRLKLGRFRSEENVLWSFSPHDFSMVLSLTGHEHLESISCKGNSFVTEGIEDVTMTNLTFSNGQSAHIYSSWINPYKEQKLVVIGTKGILTFDDTRPWNEKLSIVKDPVAYDSCGNAQVDNQEVEFLAVEEKEPLREECLHFLQCCKDRKSPKTCGREGAHTLQALQVAENSLKNGGKTIFLNEKHPYFFHPTAVIDEGAKIGDKTHIWHFSHILSGAMIGCSCTIGQNVTVFSGARLGANCKVQNNVSVYSGVICEDNVFIGPSAVFTNVNNPRSEINRRGQYESTYICQGASIGANATILCGITIGQYSFIGAGAVVTKNIKPYAIVVGNPAKQVGWMSRNGEKLDLPLSSKEPLTAKCPMTGESYQLVNDQLEYISQSIVKKECLAYEN